MCNRGCNRVQQRLQPYGPRASLQVTGAPLAVSGVSPTSMGVAGGANLVISGQGFSDASSSLVTVSGLSSF